MMSDDIAGTNTLSDARKRWPSIMDLDEIQRGGCPAFWKKAFPGEDPEQVLERCVDGEWSAFWDKTAPGGLLMYQSKGAWEDEQDELRLVGGEIDESDSVFHEPGDVAAPSNPCLDHRCSRYRRSRDSPGSG